MQSRMYVSRNGYGWQQRKRDLMVMKTMTRTENDSKADDYDGGDGDDNFSQMQRVRTGSVA